MSLEKNKALVTAFYHAFDQGELAVYDEILSQDWINHPADPGRENNPAGFKLGVEDFHKAFEGFKLSIEKCIAEEQFVVCRIKMSGKHVHDLGDFKASHRYVEFYGMDMHRIAQDQIQETWHFERLPEA